MVETCVRNLIATFKQNGFEMIAFASTSMVTKRIAGYVSLVARARTDDATIFLCNWSVGVKHKTYGADFFFIGNGTILLVLMIPLTAKQKQGFRQMKRKFRWSRTSRAFVYAFAFLIFLLLGLTVAFGTLWSSERANAEDRAVVLIRLHEAVACGCSFEEVKLILDELPRSDLPMIDHPAPACCRF